MAIKNLVIELEKDGKRSLYISIHKIPDLLFLLQHKLRIKSLLYGCVVTVYHPDMNFDNALNAGWKIIKDNRSSYIHYRK